MINIICIRGDGESGSEVITDNLIKTEIMAKKRGERYLDDNAASKQIDFSTYHFGDEILPNSHIKIPEIENKLIRIMSYKIFFTPNKIAANISGLMYE